MSDEFVMTRLTLLRRIAVEKTGEDEAVPEEDKDTAKACDFRKNASDIFVFKARVPKNHIAKLTNRELANFLETLRDTNEPSAVKETIALTVEERDE